MCLIKLHKSHECTDVNEIVNELRQQMTNDIENMNQTIKTCRAAMKDQETKEDEFSKMAEKTEKEICKRAEQLKKTIDSEKLKLLDELASLKADRIKKIQHVLGSIEERALFVDSLVKYTEELRDNGTASDIAQQARALHDRADELVETDDVKRDVSSLGFVEVSFVAVKLPTEAAGCLIGGIKWRQIEG
jgi:transketolase